MVHTGAVVAANLSHGWHNCGVKHWKSFRNDTDKRNFVSGGCAAGVAAAFGAPIGGVLFSLEEASSFWSLDLTWKSFFCAIVSTFTINLCISTYRGNFGAINDPGLLSFGAFVDNPYTLWEIPIFMAMAVFGGCAGGLFNALNQRLTKWRRDTMKGLKWQKNVEALIIAFVTATVFFFLPQIFARSCHNLPEGDFECLAEGTVDKHKAIATFFDEELYQVCMPCLPCGFGQRTTALLTRRLCRSRDTQAYTCPRGTYNDMASLSFTGQEKTIHAFFHNYHHEDVFVFTTPVCITYFVVYYVLAVWTYGIMVPSGLFVPGIICGCCFGRLTGEWVKHLTHGALWTTHAVHPGTYALLGAACMLGGMARMTISLTIILLETTNDIQYLLPIMICLMISKWVGDQFNISLYDIHVELKCIPFVEGTPSVGMEQMNAYDVATRPVVTMEQVVPLREVVDVLTSVTHNGFPVVTPNKKFAGVILRSQLVVLLRNASGKCWLDSSDGYPDPPETGPLLDHYGAAIDDFCTRLQSDTPGIESLDLDMDQMDGKYLDLRPFMNPVRLLLLLSSLLHAQPPPSQGVQLMPLGALITAGTVLGDGRHAVDTRVQAVSLDGDQAPDGNQH